MNCPVDGTPLVMADRQGIEIDYCPRCRGVWLDRGELDKLIERTAGMEYRPQPQSPSYGHERREERGHYPRRRKREGFLGDLFDFD